MNGKQRIISLLLALLLVASLAACAAAPNPTENPTEASTETPTEAPLLFSTEPVTVDNPVVFLDLRMEASPDSRRDLSVYDNGDGTVLLTFFNGVEKRVTLDAALLHNLTAVLEETELASLNGQSLGHLDNPSVASMFIEFADGSTLDARYSAGIPEKFEEGYRHMEAFAAQLTADVPVYVPRINIKEGADAQAVAAMEEIMDGADFEDINSFWIADVPKNEHFCGDMGLSSLEGLVSGTMCFHIDHHANYGIYLVTLEEGADAEAVARDFETSLNWDRYVCVRPDCALIAQKDNMVLCFNSGAERYAVTADAIKAAGWTVVKEMERSAES